MRRGGVFQLADAGFGQTHQIGQLLLAEAEVVSESADGIGKTAEGFEQRFEFRLVEIKA